MEYGMEYGMDYGMEHWISNISYSRKRIKTLRDSVRPVGVKQTLIYTHNELRHTGLSECVDKNKQTFTVYNRLPLYN